MKGKAEGTAPPDQFANIQLDYRASPDIGSCPRRDRKILQELKLKQNIHQEYQKVNKLRTLCR